MAHIIFSFTDGPKFEEEPTHVSVDFDERAELKCVAKGNPTARISWRKREQYHKLHESSTYVIPRVKKENFGVYICTAAVLGFNEVSKEVYLTQNGRVLGIVRETNKVGI